MKSSFFWRTLNKSDSKSQISQKGHHVRPINISKVKGSRTRLKMSKRCVMPRYEKRRHMETLRQKINHRTRKAVRSKHCSITEKTLTKVTDRGTTLVTNGIAINETIKKEEYYYGKRLEFIIPVSLAFTFLLLAILYAICRKSGCWSHIFRYRGSWRKQNNAKDESLVHWCTCAVESPDEVYTSDIDVEDGNLVKCTKCWQNARTSELKKSRAPLIPSGRERTPLVSAREANNERGKKSKDREEKKRTIKRKKMHKRKQRRIQSSDDSSTSKEQLLFDRNQRHTMNEKVQIPHQNFQKKIIQCIYRNNDPTCKCCKCLEYSTMINKDFH